MLRALAFASLALLSGSLLFLAGCSNSTDTDRPGDARPTTKTDTARPTGNAEHGHKPGQHGGIMIAIGTDSYHAEAVFEKGGTLHLYLLGQDETRIQEVDRQTLNAFVKAVGDPEAEPFTLEPSPTPDDATGMTSRFVGKLPARLVGKNLEVTVTNLRVGKDRFRFAFKSVSETTGHAAMPAATPDERRLYLTPGGKYTEADIVANGNTIPTVKFKGIKVEHDAAPKAGERICPISETKANPKLTWVVGGESYTFCCPPCIDEFVTRAKEQPEKIEPAEAYRKK